MVAQVEAQLPDMRARARAKLSEVQDELEQLPPEPQGSPMQQLRTLLGHVAEGMKVGWGRRGEGRRGRASTLPVRAGAGGWWRRLRTVPWVYGSLRS